ncbi:translation initiation factor elF-4e [Alphaentomopoxvirus acuprea]|uniref:Translation initiation factor elF-4e n=1 Tax=Alphaentomopoxvirus acuprea TaxID=62099 RepID=W6JLI2_9POXV|nr:translation initiation factor elF-4e [Anomala cuprea entomopoxvirus]BAO49476.1 translation initiation factor elF-4e [Anomala cuprea entomopoxvirus]
MTKHPLQHAWSLWYNGNDAHKSWDENLQFVYSFNTIEDFWCVYNYIKLPTELNNGTDYLLFKKHIKPRWEDKSNINGGKWIINSIHKVINDVWLDIVLCLIGETLDSSNNICGVILNIKVNKYKLGIWTKDIKYTDDIINIGKKIRKIINLPNKITIGYQKHKSIDTIHIL